MTNISNQIQITKSLEAFGVGHTATLGAYVGYYTAENRWYFNDRLTDVHTQPHVLDLAVLDAGGDVIRRITDDGFRRYLSLYVNGEANATLAAVFASDEIQLTDSLRLDAGGRFEYDDYEQKVERTTTFDLGGPSGADDALTYGTGEFDTVRVDFTDWAASLGATYTLTERLALFGRASRGYKMPIIDQYLFATDPADADFPDEPEQMLQAEIGARFGSPKLGLSAVAYWLELQDFPSQDAQVDPDTGETTFETAFVGKARTLGAEIEVVTQPLPYLRLDAVLTAQDPRYTDFVEGGEDYSDNRVRRIPRILWDVTGAFMYAGATLRANWHFVGHRFSNNANTIDLPAYGVVNLGLSYFYAPWGLTAAAHALNLLDGKGLTEGNPRLDESLAGVSDVFLARPVLPRRFTLEVRYEL